MNAQNDNSAPNSVGGWWASPPRSGMRRIISPWEYRHLRPWAGAHIGAGVVLAGLSGVTLSRGGNDWKTCRWTLVFLALAATQFSFGRWELTIARSPSAQI